jgi:RNase P subunit RPR2
LTALGHDFVLRRNVRIGFSGRNAPPTPFIASTFGSHHLRLVDSVASLWNSILAKRMQTQAISPLIPLPQLPEITSEETFGAVSSDHALTWGGLLARELKIEPEDEDVSAIDNKAVDHIIHTLNIDPHDLFTPSTEPNACVRRSLPTSKSESAHLPPLTVSANPLTFAGATPPHSSSPESSLNCKPLAGQNESKRPVGSSKRKAGEPDQSQERKNRRCENQDTDTPLHPFFKARTAQVPIVDTSVLTPAPIALDLLSPLPLPNSKLTRSQHFFAITTGINPLALSITTREEFVLFMEMRAQHQWKSFAMNSRRWVTATELYNESLTNQNTARGLPVILKKPRALVEKLGEIEAKIVERIQTGNFKCAYLVLDRLQGVLMSQPQRKVAASCSGSRRVQRLCSSSQEIRAEGVVKARRCVIDPIARGMNTDLFFQRKPATCTRCRTIMYPGPTGSPENHKKGVCSDGVSPALKAVEWPQPQGVFTNGTHFHPIPFLQTLRKIYEAFLTHQEPPNTIPMEHDAFVRLLASRTVVRGDGAILFRVFDLQIDSTTPDDLVIDYDGMKHLRLDCLAG